MCIRVNPTVEVSLNKKGLGIGYKIFEVQLWSGKETLSSPFAYFNSHTVNKWETCDELFRGTDPIENHGFHIYLSYEAALNTAKAVSRIFKHRIYEVYFKDVHAIGEAVNVCDGLPPYPCVVAKKMLIRKKLWGSDTSIMWRRY